MQYVVPEKYNRTRHKWSYSWFAIL